MRVVLDNGPGAELLSRRWEKAEEGDNLPTLAVGDSIPLTERGAVCCGFAHVGRIFEEDGVTVVQAERVHWDDPGIHRLRRLLEENGYVIDKPNY